MACGPAVELLSCMRSAPAQHGRSAQVLAHELTVGYLGSSLLLAGAKYLNIGPLV